MHRPELLHFVINVEEWVRRIHAVKVPVGVINSIEDALAEPQIQHRQMLVNLPHSLNAQFKMIASPIKLSDTPVEYRQAPPQLGEHTAYILSCFKSAEELQALKQQGIIDGKIA